MATTPRKTTAARKTTAPKPTVEPPAEAPVTEETVVASGGETPDVQVAEETPAPDVVAESAPAADEAPADSESVEAPQADEPAAPAVELTRENATVVTGMNAIAQSGDVPGAASEHPDQGTVIREEGVVLQHAPLEAPKPVEAPAQPAAAETQFADVATTHLEARPDVTVVDEATGEAPVAPLFGEVQYGVTQSNYRLLEQRVLADRLVSQLLVAKGARLSAPAAAKIAEYVEQANTVEAPAEV